MPTLRSADKKSYALSIQDYDETSRQRIIKHYRIRRTDNGDCYISPRSRFPTVIDLINHYSGMSQIADQSSNAWWVFLCDCY